MRKAELRNIYRQKRSPVTVQQNVKWTDLILINFQKIELPFLNCVHTYLAMQHKNEIDTAHIIQYLEFLNPGLSVAVPKINATNQTIENYIFKEDTELIMHKFGMKEPEIMTDEIDLILIPLLAFDKQGHRVGYGKGFYDKLLSECKPLVIKIGLSFFEAEDNIDDINQNDVAMDYCVTPQNIYTF